MDDDGVQHFGSPSDGGSGFVDWDTPEWRAEMADRYGDGGTRVIDTDTND